MKKNVAMFLVLLMVLSIALLLSACNEANSGQETESRNYIDELDEEWREGQPIGVLSQWEKSKHAEEGVTCNVCHGNDPSDIRKPSAGTCGACHNTEYEEFSESTHSTSLVHAMSKDTHVYNGKEVEYKWQAYPEGGPDKWGCANCHSIGYIAEDETMGDCSSCHGSHEFSLQQARSPETCNDCHAGPGHPNYESYIQSTHGILWETLGSEWDLSGSTEEFWARQETDPVGGALCITCHMSQGSHNTGNGMAHDLYGNRVEDYEEQITFMVDNSCTTCHSEAYSRRWLSDADEIAGYTLDRLNDARGIMASVREDGLIRPTMEVTNSHPIAGQLSGVESKFFNIVMATNRARKGAYHMSSQWAGRLGWTDQSFALMEFRSEVERLRSDAERDERIKELENR